MPRRRRTKPIFIADISCMSKRRFKSEVEAKDAADFRMLENMSVELEVYLCPNCHFWHLTRRKKEER